MVQFYDSISDDLRDWALQQQVFFIASAPLTGSHINLSPKGLPASTLTVFDPNHVAYIDATGSGIETISHVYENGRATIMFCSFDKSPRIMRWFCKGRVVEYDDPEFEGWLKKMGKEKIVGTRAVILFDVWKVQTSCGYAVPLVSSNIDPVKIDEGPRAYLEDRKTLGHWAGKHVEAGTLQDYHQKMNARSHDGCGGLKAARRARGEHMLLEDCMIWMRRTTQQREAMLVGALLAILTMLALRFVVEGLGLRLPSSIRGLQ
ncbi:hypothetical protein BAUCODRAFT_79423 [Baudoinia panamericana UAMH 10762]|uniref:Pyridoxamine 5'-phosphate oxidase putative domain-containing protein n=1 Tax=Baudoinia panamericana (strain UAMH 10762) TaxID=717646 RepID=M2M548_BAUPA|nr:uncharacterized protein BAUCODRAFT_79423 [Baudoinia panamericana UAMH 10762]EMC91741.1 hypothetical protein BAUCODRAFT_79423 [Baudoinia panamericana UAMH 10762]